MASVIHVRHDWSEGIDWPQNSVSTLCGMRSKGKRGFPTTDRNKDPFCGACLRSLYHEIKHRLPQLKELQADSMAGMRVFHTILWYENMLTNIEPKIAAWNERQRRLREERNAARQCSV